MFETIMHVKQLNDRCAQLVHDSFGVQLVTSFFIKKEFHKRQTRAFIIARYALVAQTSTDSIVMTCNCV